MRRRLLNLLTALSLLLCVAVAALWVRSYSTLDRLDWVRSNSAGLDGPDGWWARRRCSVESGRGMIVVEWVRQSQTHAGPLGGIA